MYSAGGTQIGFATLGGRSERLTFPALLKIGDALESKEWARFFTAGELAEDPTRPVRYLPAAERPHYLVYKDVLLPSEVNAVASRETYFRQ